MMATPPVTDGEEEPGEATDHPEQHDGHEHEQDPRDAGAEAAEAACVLRRRRELELAHRALLRGAVLALSRAPGLPRERPARARSPSRRRR